MTDLGDLPPVDAPEGSDAAATRTRFFREVVEAGTSRRTDAAWPSAVRCVGRVGRRACRSRVQVGRVVAGTVTWSCPSCGDHGDVTGFEGTAHDLSPFVPQGGKLRVWAIDDQERRVLLDATTRSLALRAVVSRASPALEVEQALMIQATLDELDAIYTLVEQLTDATKSRRRIQFLDDVRRGLCGAMDGF